MAAPPTDLPPEETFEYYDVIDLLEDSQLLASNGDAVDAEEELEHCKIGLFFGADYDDARTTVDLLIDFFLHTTSRGEPFQVVFVSCDATQDAMWDYIEKLDVDWLVLPFGSALRRHLFKRFRVHQIPKLVVVDEHGTTVTINGFKDIDRYGYSAFRRWETISTAKDPTHTGPIARTLREEELHRSRTAVENRNDERFVWRTKTVGDGFIVEEPRRSRGFVAEEGEGDQSRQSSSPNKVDKRGIAPIHVAMRDHNIQLFRMLMSKGVDLDVADSQGRNPLHYAAMHGGWTLAQIKRHWMQHHEMVWTRMMITADRHGNVPLHYACRHGHRDIARFLIHNRKDSTQKENNKGRFPYEEMVLAGKSGFLGNCEEANILTPGGYAQHIAEADAEAGNGDAEDLDRVVFSNNKHKARCNTALLSAIHAEDIDEVRRLLNETPADPLATKDGTTIIEYAVQTGNVGIVKLLDLKANPGKLVNIDLFEWDEPSRHAFIEGDWEDYQTLQKKKKKFEQTLDNAGEYSYDDEY